MPRGGIPYTAGFEIALYRTLRAVSDGIDRGVQLFQSQYEQVCRRGYPSVSYQSVGSVAMTHDGHTEMSEPSGLEKIS